MMKIENYRIFVLFFFMIYCVACSDYESGENNLEEIMNRGEINIGIRADNPPHSFIDSSGNLVGFDVDIANAIASDLGVNINIVRVDELTRISFIENRTIDIAVASMSHTHLRDEKVDFSQTYFQSYQTFLVRSETNYQLEDLIDKPVGFSLGSHAISNWIYWLEQSGHPVQKENILEFDNKQAAIEAVKQGYISGWAEDVEVLAYYSAEDSSLKVLSSEKIGSKQDGVGMMENQSDLRDRINLAIQNIYTSGEYETIYNIWFGKESRMPIPLNFSIEVWPNGE